MSKFTIISTVIMVIWIFPVAAAIITPPDVISQIVVAVEMTITYGIMLYIVSRFKSLKQAPENIRRLIVVLLCLLSISTIYTVTLFGHCLVLYKKIQPSQRIESER